MIYFVFVFFIKLNAKICKWQTRRNNISLFNTIKTFDWIINKFKINTFSGKLKFVLTLRINKMVVKT